MTLVALPVLTFPDDVARFVRTHYSQARVILEYGSGGSTFLAAQQSGKKIVSIESDPVWAARMRSIAASRPLASAPVVIHANVGPVGAWARPVDNLWLDHFYSYAQMGWEICSPDHPDLILIDGRFRAACFMAAYLNSTKPVRVLFDDYEKRRQYHVIERICRPTERVGRMIAFDIVPEERERIEPWLLVATFLDAVTSFQVGVGPRRNKLKDQVREAVKMIVSKQRHESAATGSDSAAAIDRCLRRSRREGPPK
jgi:hypothetical protein